MVKRRGIIVLIIIIFMLYFFNKDTINRTTENKKAKWIEKAFISLESDYYPKIKAISWWHEDFDHSFLKINSSTESLRAYQKGIRSSTFVTTANFSANKLIEPMLGIYHSSYPDFGGTEDIVSGERMANFEKLAKKKIVWAYFSNNWYKDIQFPLTEVNIINGEGKIPFIRIMPRSNFNTGGPDPIYTLQEIIDGKFDKELTQWAIDASNTNMPLLVEFGTEVNGDWFPWNGAYNGAGETTEYGDSSIADGGERFKYAYRHIVDICNLNGANNITWFFHVNAYSDPSVDWNELEHYYPGDAYVDWLGVSIYGPQENKDTYQEFSDLLDAVYPSLTKLSNKPIAVLEFAITEIK